jgi:hypothetical protein
MPPIHDRPDLSPDEAASLHLKLEEDLQRLVRADKGSSPEAEHLRAMMTGLWPLLTQEAKTHAIERGHTFLDVLRASRKDGGDHDQN